MPRLRDPSVQADDVHLRQRLDEQARALRRDAHPLAAPLVRAMREAARGRPDRRARRWQTAIETERRRLQRSEDPLSGGRGTESTVGKVTRQASSPPGQAALLFTLARRLPARRSLEMGTCVGVSGAYLAAGMAVAGGGMLRSIDSHEDRSEVARRTWARLGLDDAEAIVGKFRLRLGDALDEGPYDLVFVDGHHDGDATRIYVEQIAARSRPGAVLCLDDIAWSDGMTEAWHDVRARYNHGVSVDLGRLGLIVLGAGDAGLA